MVIFLASFALAANAFEGLDECGEFKKLALKEIPQSEDHWFPWQDDKSFGLVFDYSTEGKTSSSFFIEKIFTPDDHDGDKKLEYLKVEKIYPELQGYRWEDFDQQTVLSGIVMINDIPVTDLTEAQLQTELKKDTISLLFSDSDEKFIFNKEEFKVFDIAIEPDIHQIYNVNPKEQKFSTKLNLTY